MTPVETVQLVALVAAVCPAMRMEESTPDAWFAVLGHLDFADSKAAVVRLARTMRFIGPADVVGEVKVIRSDRLDRGGLVEPPPVDPDDARDYSRQLRAGLAAVAAGRDVARALTAAPDRTPCPPKLRNDGAKVRVAALDVPCPHCNALFGEWCVVPGASRRPDGGVHPARVAALAEQKASGR